MPKYLIERELPGAGNLTQPEIKGIVQGGMGVLSEMGANIQWVESYVTADKVYCVYIAPNEGVIREHAQRAGMPANSIAKVLSIIDPITAED
jgi:Protein of unknown function (DUF4242)